MFRAVVIIQVIQVGDLTGWCLGARDGAEATQFGDLLEGGPRELSKGWMWTQSWQRPWELLLLWAEKGPGKAGLGRLRELPSGHTGDIGSSRKQDLCAGAEVLQ